MLYGSKIKMQQGSMCNEDKDEQLEKHLKDQTNNEAVWSKTESLIQIGSRAVCWTFSGQNTK